MDGALLAKAVAISFREFVLKDPFETVAGLCTNLKRAGCALAWMVYHTGNGTEIFAWFFKRIFESGVWRRATSKKFALPIREGGLKVLVQKLKHSSLEEISTKQFGDERGRWTWILFLACYCCNTLWGYCRPLEPGGWNAPEKKVVIAVGEAVDRLLCHGHVECPIDPLMEKDLLTKRANYQGEEMGTCHKLTLKQVLPALPPKDHGGAIDSLDFVSESTKSLLISPHKSILPDVGQPLPKLRGRVHAEAGEIDSIADELVKRGVCSWVPLHSVVKYRGEHVLNGLFGVAKPSLIDDGRPVLRLIMNLVPSNSIMQQFSGAVQNLPSITSWMSTVLEGDEEIRVWQSDMSNAFYLFKIPDPWLYFLAFNVIRHRRPSDGTEPLEMALACRVLPMGWGSSVAIMQEISERILQTAQIDPLSQLVRSKPVPQWMVGILHKARRESRLWWHIYLDNFAAGQTIKNDDPIMAGDRLHQLAERAWSEAGVISSEKKKQVAIRTAHELGAFIDGKNQTIGGPPERFLKLIQATLWVLNRPQLSKRLVQVIAGRWVHVMQFRRPTMSILDKTWEFISGKKFKQDIVLGVRRELMTCICSIPLMHTFLGAPISERMTASDAWNRGGAVGVASNLTGIGEDYVKSAKANHDSFPTIPVVVVSLFGGIGGAFRVYDLLGVRPLGLLHFDIHGPANRVVSRRWPHAKIYTDVRKFDREMAKRIVAEHLGVVEIHLWAGFPCVDLSSVRAGGKGLEGKSSSLFYEVLRIRKLLIEEGGSAILVKVVVENVASMRPEECDKISAALQLEPYYLDCVDAVPMRRPRLCWTTEYLDRVMDDVWTDKTGRWKVVHAEASYPPTSAWLEPGCTWPGGESNAVIPTCMKAIKRNAPPYKPAGVDRCDGPTLSRWAADEFRYPPYQYSSQFIVWTERGSWRTISAEEKEILLGYGWKHTALCYSASDIKKSYQQYDDERNSLLGDSFSMYSFIIPAFALCQRYITRVRYAHLVRRMGLSPGFRCGIRFVASPGRCLNYGGAKLTGEATVQILNKLLLSRTNHTGSDVRISTGEFLNPKAHPRQGVEADWWDWKACFKVKWQTKEHINLLELRSIFLAIKYQVSHFKVASARLFHLTDSYICLSIISKGRSGSKQLTRVLKQLNAFLLSHGLYLILAHIDSTTNPTDGESRSLDI